MCLNSEQMFRQSQYESSLFFVKKMLSSGIITDAEFPLAKEYLETEYKPIIRH